MAGERGGVVSGPRGSRLALAVMVGVVALTGTAAHAGGEDVGPDLQDLHLARAAARRFRAPGGLRRAVHALCRGESLPEDEAASVVLVAHGARAMPLLLDTLPAPHASLAARACWSAASRTILAAVCAGRVSGGGYGLDRRSDAAVERARAAAGKALIRALTGKVHRRRRAALRAFLGTWTCEDHPRSRRRARAATPALVTLLGDAALRRNALEALAFDGVDARVARVPLERWLGPEDTLPRAARALARMGEPLGAVVPRLRRLLGGADVTLVVQALGAIGPDARAALPDLANLARRLGPNCQGPVRPRELVTAVGRIATRPGDRAAGVAALTPLLRCQTDIVRPASIALLSLGPAGTPPVVALLRRDAVPYYLRLEAARALIGHGVSLDASDRAIVRLLGARERRLSPAVPQVPPPGPGPTDQARAAEAWRACRAEVGKPALALPTLPDGAARALASCLDRYLCGPTDKSYEATVARCCARAFGDHPLAFCAADR